jgi:RND superfamily putative drug exporter
MIATEARPAGAVVSRSRWIVVAGWVVLALAGGMAAAQSGHRLSVAFDLPGQSAYETSQAADGRTAFQLLYPVPDFASSDPYAAALPGLNRAVADLRVDGAPVLVTGGTIVPSGGSGGGSSV